MNIFDLQIFATQTTLLPGLSDEMKTYYEKRLIDLAEPKLVHDQFGDKYPIPKNGGKTIEFRKYDSLDKAMTPLVEGVTPTGNSLNVSAITATIDQYGDYIQMSDILELTAIDNNVVQATKLLGSQAGRTLDSITRDVLAGGTNVIFAQGTGGSPITSRGELDPTCTLEPDLFFKAAAQLEAYNADYIDDSFVAIIHPYAAYDLMRSQEWIDVHKYAQPQNIYEGEIGKIGNVRFVGTTEAKVWKDTDSPITAPAFSTSSTYAVGDVVSYNSEVYKCKTAIGTAGAWDGSKWDKMTDGTGRAGVFGTLVLGAHAFGTTDVTGGGLQHIVKQLGYGEDPLNQRSSVGWKATKVAERLVEQYMVRIESVSSYSETVQAN